MNSAEPVRFVPPVPTPPKQPLALRQFLRAIRTNALTIWPQAAYEEDMSVRHFLGRTNVLVNAPDAIHHVLVDNHANYRRSPASIRILRPITGDGLLLSHGEAWKLQRRTIAPALAPRVMPMLARHIVRVARHELDQLQARAAEGWIDLLAAMQNLALEIAGRSMFSMEMRQYGPVLRRMLTEFGERHAHPHLLDMLLPPSIPAPRDFARRRFQKRWMALIDGMMRERLRLPCADTARDLFDLLRAARDPETGAGFSPEELRDQVATLILAGHETTAVTLFWALTLLAQAPGEQEAVAREVSGVSIDPETAFAGLQQLPRTRAIVSETLRLFPPAFTLVREAIGTDQLGPLRLPGRSVVMIAPWVLHRHRALWENPDAFDPTRFMPGQPAPQRFAYLPFGAGPRICVGAQFAMAEATLVLASVIARFRVALDDPRPVMPVAVVTTQPDHPPMFRLRVR
jgi:cytochrome P450